MIVNLDIRNEKNMKENSIIVYKNGVLTHVLITDFLNSVVQENKLLKDKILVQEQAIKIQNIKIDKLNEKINKFVEVFKNGI